MNRITIAILTLVFFLTTTVAYSQTKWKTFNHKNGFSIQLPSYFSTGILVAGGTLQWYDNTFDKDIQITVESFGNGESGKLSNEFESRQITFTTVSYKVLKATWFVVSGESDEGITYEKTILKEGMLHTLRISYPQKEKAIMDTWIPKISISFK